MGGESPVNRSSSRSAFRPSIVVYQGTPHVAWQEFDGANSEIRVARLDHGSGTWEEIPDVLNPINRNPNRNASDASLAVVGDALHVAWSEHDGLNWEVRVARLHEPAMRWEEVAGGESPINHSPLHDGLAPRLADVEGVPYVAWAEWDGVNNEVRVASLGGAGWEEVVGGDSPINHSDSHDASHVSLAADGDEPYVAWQEWDGTNYEVRVAEWEPGHTEWEHVVDGPSPVNRSSTRSAIRPSLVAIEGIWYVAWSETDGRNFELRVARLNPSGTAWDELVGGESPINHSPTQDAFRPNLTAIGGTPYVAWTEATGSYYTDYHSDEPTPYEIHVARLNAPATAWEHIIRADSPINDAAGSIGSEPSLAGVGGVPYVAWREFDGQNSELRIARLEPEFLDGSELAGERDVLVLQRVRTYGVSYPVVISLASGQQVAMRTAADASEDVLSTRIDGLQPGGTYTWSAFGWDGVAKTGASTLRTFTTRATGDAPPPPTAEPPGAPASEAPSDTPAAVAAPRRASRLVLVPMRRKFLGRAGRSVTMRYLLDRRAKVAISVVRRQGRKRRRVARFSDAGRRGRNRAVWRGRRVRPGRYTVRFSARVPEGGVARATALLVVRR